MGKISGKTYWTVDQLAAYLQGLQDAGYGDAALFLESHEDPNNNSDGSLTAVRFDPDHSQVDEEAGKAIHGLVFLLY